MTRQISMLSLVASSAIMSGFCETGLHMKFDAYLSGTFLVPDISVDDSTDSGFSLEL